MRGWSRKHVQTFQLDQLVQLGAHFSRCNSACKFAHDRKSSGFVRRGQTQSSKTSMNSPRGQDPAKGPTNFGCALRFITVAGLSEAGSSVRTGSANRLAES